MLGWMTTCLKWEVKIDSKHTLKLLGTVIGQMLDKIGLGQNLDKVWTSNLVTWPHYEIDNTWTKTGHFIVQDLSNTKIFGQVYFSLTIFGQMTTKSWTLNCPRFVQYQ